MYASVSLPGAEGALNYCSKAEACKCCAAQLLGELLLDRANVKVMMRYVSDSKNLQMMMMLLKDNSRSIQFEAFHVFKVQRPATLL